ncbi:MAG: winged helix-turn-helix transcriptional regulator [Candidatus Bathyarchaeia archaeon]
MKIEEMLEKPAVKILLLLYHEEDVIYRDLTDLISSRGTISTNMNSLEEEELIQRRVEPTRSPKSFYSRTEKGEQVARYLHQAKNILRRSKKID